MNRRLLYSAFAVNILFGAVLLFFVFRHEPARVFAVDYELVFRQFDMTKEVQKEGDRLLRIQEKKLDSLDLLLRINASVERNAQIMKVIFKEKDSLESFRRSYAVESSDKIWKRITSYSKDFAQAKGYDFILNSNQRAGTVIYSGSTPRSTEEFINFLNKKYAGIK